MKSIFTIVIFLSLVVSGLAQTRSVIVNTSGVVQSPTNFWSADVTNARSGLGLGSAATNLASAFQPSSSELTSLATNNGATLTNIPVSGVVGALSSFATLAITNGGSGAITAGGARTNLGLPLAALTNANVTNFRSAIGLGFLALTNANTAGFNASLYGSGTNPVLYNTNGEVVSPTNFWQNVPSSLFANAFQKFNLDNLSATNNATNTANLLAYSIAANVGNITNTINLPTNGSSGNIATIVHTGPTNSVTAIRKTGGTNLITLNKTGESVRFVYDGTNWSSVTALSFTEPVFFVGTNAVANAAASRTNLGLGATDDVVFLSLNAILDAGDGNTVVLNSAISFDDVRSENIVETTRTNLGLGLPALTNTNNANFQAAIFNTNSVPTNSANVNAVNFNTVVHWMEVNVVTNGVTNSFRLPLFK